MLIVDETMEPEKPIPRQEPEQYVLILVDDDGEVSINCLDKDTLLLRLNEGYYGEGEHALRFYNHIPPRDPMNWGPRGAFLIKGTITSPKPQETVVKYSL